MRKVLVILMLPIFILISCAKPSPNSNELENKNDASPTKTITLYYPQATENDMHIVSTNVETSVNSAEDIKNVFQDYFQNPVKDNLSPLISKNTKINKVYLDNNENKVYADFSNELIDEMNAGSSMELSIITSITNTLGNYYGVDQVYITVDGEAYSSGHIALDEEESFTVDYDEVTELE